MANQAVRTILADCHRRALFTRMHAQLNREAMFSSIEKCRDTLQVNIPRIGRKDLQNEAMELLAAVEGIERMKVAPDPDAINKLKIAALHSFRKLAEATRGSYPLPESGKLGEAVYFTQSDAEAPLNIGDLKNPALDQPHNRGDNLFDWQIGAVASGGRIGRCWKRCAAASKVAVEFSLNAFSYAALCRPVDDHDELPGLSTSLKASGADRINAQEPGFLAESSNNLCKRRRDRGNTRIRALWVRS